MCKRSVITEIHVPVAMHVHLVDYLMINFVLQKFRLSTRQRRRLRDDKPPTPLHKTKKTTKSAGKTPNKLAYRDVKMYSPFTIDTPRRNTPRGIRTVSQSIAWYTFNIKK